MAEVIKTGTEGLDVGSGHASPAGSTLNGEPGLPKGSPRELDEVSYVAVQGTGTRRGGGSIDKGE